MKLLLSLIFTLFLIGCGTEPIHFDGLTPREAITSIRGSSFRVSPRNKYLVLIEGHTSVLKESHCSTDEIDAKSEKIEDTYIHTDILETAKLAIRKGYDAYNATSDADLESILDKIWKVSNDKTQLMIAMSGECDDKGFIINLVHTSGGLNLVPPGKKLLAVKIIAHLGLINGTKAVIINGCQSGCFAEAAQKDADFNGVVIAACPVGYATTPCQRTGTSAVYASFLGLYKDDPKAIINLSTADISPGCLIENFRHKFSDIGSGGLPISYSAVKYSTANFNF